MKQCNEVMSQCTEVMSQCNEVISPYRLANEVIFQENQDQTGGILSIPYPRRIIRLSANGAKTLKKLCGQPRGPGEWDEKTTAFAVNLENQGIIMRNFPPMADEDLPVVSIVIPTYNRQPKLTSCLESLLALDYPQNKLEIIVVDDKSPVPVVLEEILVTVPPMLSLIRMRSNKGPGAARNAAVQLAKGEIIAFLDDDCLASKEWLKALVPCFQHPEVAAAGGRVESAKLSRPLERYEQVQSPLLMGNSQRKVRKGSALSYLATCNLLVRKNSFLDVKGFEPELKVGEDVDLCRRILEKGELIYYIPEGLIFHHHRSQLIPFLSRRFNYGQSEARLHSRNPEEKRLLVFFPGNSIILGATMLTALIAGVLPALAAGMGLTLLNLCWQSVRKLQSIKSAECKPGLRLVLTAMLKSQGTAVYLSSQHFSRYYSIPANLIALLTMPWLILIFMAIQLLPAIVDYHLKRPSLNPVYFTLYYVLENIFYQAGVFSGCCSEHNWQPLTMKFIRADANLLRVLATGK